MVATESIPAADISADAARVARDLRVVFGRLRRRMREVADAADLTPSQVSALMRLGKHEASSASALAGLERVRPQSMAATLAVLERRGLIRRGPDPADGRRQVITLTAAGRERVEGNRQAREEWLARALQDSFAPDQLRTVEAALALLLDRLTEE